MCASPGRREAFDVPHRIVSGEAFAKQHGGAIVASYVEVETGKRSRGPTSPSDDDEVELQRPAPVGAIVLLSDGAGDGRRE